MDTASRGRGADPLAAALRAKARAGAPGLTESRPLAAGDGWRVVDVVCTSGPHDDPFEERHDAVSVSLVVSGTFTYHGEHGAWLMAPGALLLGNVDRCFECSHAHAVGDRCLSFRFEPELFERLAHAAGAARPRFGLDRLPPLRALAPISARARLTAEGQGSFEEVALELAAAAVALAGPARRGAPAAAPRDPAPIARALWRLESRFAERCSLADLAAEAGLSPYHFLRTFKRVTGATPHQWLLRARLRRAAEQLVASRDPITQIALDVGFEDLSNFVRSFRAEFGVPPGRYRAGA